MKTNAPTPHYSSKTSLLLGSILWIMASVSGSLTGQSPGREYFVSKTGSDEHPGTQQAPFLTISRAAQEAMPGDVITVSGGTYREWVKPPRGGSSEDKRITYRVAEGAEVRILGSEAAGGWKEQAGGLWYLELPDSFFGDFNPFKTQIRHPVYVAADEEGDGWGWLKYGRWTHRGDVYLNGQGLTEKEQLEKLDARELCWFVEAPVNGGDQSTRIWASFAGADPNAEEVEINVRPFAFFPERKDVNYITLKGFQIANVATHWAPPTVFQPGAVGSNGGHHWIIEHNHIRYSRALGISLGIPSDISWTDEAWEEVSQRGILGHHIVRNNVIRYCGQGGIGGQGWATHSQIYGNHIEYINHRREFGGWETAGIKHHHGDSMYVCDNFIRGIYTLDPSRGAAHGIWVDFMNHNWQVRRNLVLECEAFGILSEANWTGPNLFANNILVNASIGMFSTRGDAWVHNLFINSEHQWMNQPYGKRPQIGNSRWYNNLFLERMLDPEVVEDGSIYRGNLFLEKTSWSLEESPGGILLQWEVIPELMQAERPLISHADLDLPFVFDAGISRDYFKQDRSSQNLPGPFTSLEEGKMRIRLYSYPLLY